MARTFIRGNTWWIEYHHGGKRYRERASKDKRIATKCLRKRLSELDENRFLNVKQRCKLTLADFGPRFIAWSKQHKRSWRRDVRLLANLGAHFNNKNLERITLADVERYRTARLSGALVFNNTPAGSSTVNRELACLRRLLNLAADLGVLGENPLKGKIKMSREPEGRVRYLKPVEIERLLDACADHIRPIVHLALLTGCRRSELLGLQWEEADLARGAINLPGTRTKNGRPRTIPLNAEARVLLRAQQKGNVNGSPLVFHKPDGSHPGDIKTAFNAACRRAKIRDFRFHDLRHCFASALAMRGVPLQAVGELLGHRMLAMTQRYAHLSPQMLMGAVEQAARYLEPDRETGPAALAMVPADDQDRVQNRHNSEAAGIISLSIQGA
ncbi:MAG TPA: site-specific integrase [Myxococcota bacterium]|nr:site-specific integrase [Myxococcota bacterium]